jgi:hypothetical protein
MPQVQQRLVGRFKRSGSKESQLGELTLAGEDTTLVLRSSSKSLVDLVYMPPALMHGTTVDRQKVSLLRCVGQSAPSTRVGGRRSYSAVLFPNYVLLGDKHLNDDSRIAGASFTLRHAHVLFYDFFVFGEARHPKEFIKEILRSNFPDEKAIEVGPHPQVHYYTGKTVLLETVTSLGSVAVGLKAAWTLPSPRGIYVPNAIEVDVNFSVPLSFEDSLATLTSIVDFFALLAGARQSLDNLTVRLEAKSRNAPTLMVYRPLTAGDPIGPATRQSRDSLMPYMSCKDEIGTVMQRWVARSQDWTNARRRFFDVFSMDRNYTIDRLVAAANMFDLLPKSSVPESVPVTLEVRDATAKCKQIFKALPDSLEKQDMLDALNRVGRTFLKHKIRHRAKVVVDTIGSRVPRLTELTDQAVKCRNHFVHGSRGSFDYGKNFHAVTYLCDTLEFVFGCSDLIEAGWDARSWADRSGGHPFNNYLHSYLRASKEVLSLAEGAGPSDRPRSNAA